MVSDDLVDIAVFQDPGIERITLACDTVVEGNDALLEALYHCQIRMAAAQLQDIDGKAANVNDIGRRNELSACRTVVTAAANAWG